MSTQEKTQEVQNPPKKNTLTFTVAPEKRQHSLSADPNSIHSAIRVGVAAKTKIWFRLSPHL
jgi:hypothetical protein